MITKNTVLILGAGASRPYGFPTGFELVDIIARGQIPQDVLAQMQQHYPGTNAVGICAEHLCPPIDKMLGGQVQGAKFRSTLLRSQVYSIDAYLAANPALVDVGKRAIAEVIIRCEGREPPAWDWYRELFNRLIAQDVETYGRLSIITFNYDRSLEWYLFNCFLNFLPGFDQAKAMECMREIRFVHVYGNLGPVFGTNVVPYGDFESVARAANNIEIVRAKQKSRFHSEIQDVLSDAEQVAFIGFSFDPLNLDALGIPRLSPTGDIPTDSSLPGWDKVLGRIFASCHNLPEPTKNHAQERLGPIEWRDAKALEFVKGDLILR